MGLGLDRLLMLAKGVPDIRLLRSTDPRVVEQMKDLLPYRPVSSMPPAKRDLSIAVADDVTPEELGDRVRVALGDASSSLESVEVLSQTSYAELPNAARRRLGIAPGANVLRDRIYEAIHEGTVWTWASDRSAVQAG